MSIERFEYDAFFIDQLIRPVANLYRISTLAADGASAGDPVAFVRQKRLALKEDIGFYADESEQEELFRLKARRVIEVGGRYDVVTPEGRRLGVLAKHFGASLLRSTWTILDSNEEPIALARERSMPVALLRRVIDAVPYGELVPILYHFTITADGRDLGELRRPIGVRDRYVLRLDGDAERRIG